MPLNSPKCPPYWNSTSGFHFHTSPQSTCHSAPVSEIFIQIGPPSAEKKITSCRFSRWRISTIFDFRDPIVGSFKIPCTTSYRSSIDTVALNCSVFLENSVFAFWRQDPRWRFSAILDSNIGLFEKPMYDFLYVVNRHHSSKVLSFFLRKSRFFAFWRHDPRWRISAMLDFRGPIIGSVKSPCATFYRSSIDTVALNCLVFEKIAFFAFWRQTDKQTDKQTNRWTAPMHKAALAIASSDLTSCLICGYLHGYFMPLTDRKTSTSYVYLTYN